MKILVSGEAGLVGVLAPTPSLRPLDGPPRLLSSEAEVRAVMSPCGDVHEFDVDDEVRADELCSILWSVDRCVRLVLQFCSLETEPAELVLIADALEDTLDEAGTMVTSLAAGPILKRLQLSALPEEQTQLLGRRSRVLLGLDEAEPNIFGSEDGASLERQIHEFGVVTWLDQVMELGMIEPKGGGHEILVHISAVERALLPSLSEGDVVRFDLEQKGGPTVSATNLKAIKQTT